MFKKFMAVLVCASLAFSNPAFSASFGKSSSGSSSGPRSSGTSSSSKPTPPSRPAATPQRSSPPSQSSGSLSRGQSVGMTRSAVTESVRNNTYKQAPTAAPAPRPVDNYANRTPNNQGSGSTGYQNNNQGYNNYGNNGYNNGYNRNYGNSGYQTPQPPPRSYGMGTVIGAAAVGALVGYLMHRDSSGNSYFTHPNNPNVAYDSNGNRMSSVPQGNFTTQGTVASNGTITPSASESVSNNYPVGTAPSYAPAQTPASNSGGSGFGWIVFLLLVIAGMVGAAIYFMNRRKPSIYEPSNNTRIGAFANAPAFVPSHDPQSELASSAQQMFIDFQKNNCPSQIDEIEARSDPVFFEAIKDTVLEASDTKKVIVKSIETEVVNVAQENGQLVGSVRYRGVINEQNGQDINKITVDEVWHYVYRNNKWLLAGIEAVNPEINEDIDGNPDKKYSF